MDSTKAIKTQATPKRETWRDILHTFKVREPRNFKSANASELASARGAIVRYKNSNEGAGKEFTTESFNGYFTITRTA